MRRRIAMLLCISMLLSLLPENTWISEAYAASVQDEGGEEQAGETKQENAPETTEGETTGGSTEGTTEGGTEGTTEGSTEGTTEGGTEGTTEGSTEGTTEGAAGGSTEGSTEGTTEGAAEGTTEGSTEGTAEDGQAPLMAAGVELLSDEHEHAACSHELTGEECTDESLTWAAWGTTYSLPTTAGNYYLTCDVTLSAKWEPQVNVNLCLNGHTISKSSSVTNATALLKVASVNIVIMDCQASLDSDGMYLEGEEQKGGKLTGGTGNEGGAIWMNGGTLTLIGICMTENKNSTSSSGWGGGAIQVRGGTVNICHSLLTENEATDGGALCVRGGTVNLTSTVLKENIITNSGGSAIHILAESTVNLTDCVIEGNTASGTSETYRGGIYINNADTEVTVSGKTVIRDNTVGNSGKVCNVYLNTSDATKLHTLYVVKLAEGSDIGITDRTTRSSASLIVKSATGATISTWDPAWVHYDNGSVETYNYYMAWDGEHSKFVFSEKTTHSHSACAKALTNGVCASCAHTDLVWEPWTNEGSLPTAAGNYYLTTDVVLSGTSVQSYGSGTVRICLNGHDITTAESKSRRLFTVSGATMVVMDCQATLGSDGMYVEEDSETGATQSGGKLAGGVSGGGGAASVNSGTLTLIGVDVCDNQDTAANNQWGGGAVRATGGSLTIYHSRFANNEAKSDGGAICARGACVTVAYTVFDSNKAASEGGAIFKYGSNNLTFEGPVLFAGNTAGGGGAVYVTGAGVLTMTEAASAEFEENSSTADGASDAYVGGGALYLQSSSGDNVIKKVIFTGNSSANVGGALLVRGSNLTVSNSTFSENTAAKSGGAVYETGTSVLTMTECALSENQAADMGGAMYAGGASCFTLTECGFSDNQAVTKGGAICCYTSDADKTSTIKDCTFTGNKTTSTEGDSGEIVGAAILNGSDGPLAIKDSTFTANEAAWGGGTVGLDGGVVTMSGVAMTGNLTNDAGGTAIQAANKATLTLDDCTITDNINLSAGASYRGGVYITDSETQLTLSGKTVIQNNTISNGAKTMNVYLQSAGTQIIVGELEEGSVIGITLRNSEDVEPDNFLVRGEGVTELGGYLVYENRNYAIYLSSDQDTLFYYELGSHTHRICADTGCSEDHEAIFFLPWTITDALPDSGNWVLTVDVVLSTPATVSGATLNLCLNGHTVSIDPAKEDRTFWVGSNKDEETIFNLTDCTTSGKVVGGALSGDRDGGVILAIGAKTQFTLYGGTLTGGNAYQGGAIALRSGASMVMYDGTIKGNYARKHGGAIQNNSTGTFTMWGGKITENKAVRNGGAVSMSGGAGMFLAGGSIEYNKGVDGGGIAVNGKDYGACLYFQGGTVAHNDSSNNGGGIYLTNSAYLDMSGGSLTDNEADEGAGIFMYKSTAVFSSGLISRNVADSNGGGIATSGGGEISMSGVILRDNRGQNGGGVLLQGKTEMTMKDCLMEGNSSVDHGGAIYASTNSTLTIHSGEIRSNTAGQNGAAIYHLKSYGFYLGGTIHDNTANENGGAVFFSESKAIFCQPFELYSNYARVAGGGMVASKESYLYMYGGTIRDNSSESGGGVVVQSKSNFNMWDGEISANTSKKNGGGMYISTECAVNLYGGAIKNNTATQNGGGIVTSKEVELNLDGATISGNTAENGAGILVQGADAVLTISAGTVEGNHAIYSGAGLYVSKNTELVMSGGVISKNTADSDGGGIFHLESKGSYTGGTITGNEAERNGGGLITSGTCELTMNGLTVTGNSAVNAGGGLLLQGNDTLLTLKSASFTENLAKQGGGIYASRNTMVEMSGGLIGNNEALEKGGGLLLDNVSVISGGQITGNRVTGGADIENPYGGGVVLSNREGNELTLTGGEITGNYCVGDGGGLVVGNYGQLLMSGGLIANNEAKGNGGGIRMGGLATITGGEIRDNKASGNGGGISTCAPVVQHQRVPVELTASQVEISGNEASMDGGGIYMARGSYGILSDMELTGNTAEGNGSALWAVDELTLHSLTATGNTVGGVGSVYLEDGSFDGESYFTGLIKMTGDMRILDNEGEHGDLYIAGSTTVSIGKEGLGADTYMAVRLENGVLTSTIYGDYDYEGGDLEYVVTDGNRSAVEPEPNPLAKELDSEGDVQEEVKETGETDTEVLYLAVLGVCVLLLALLLILMKRLSKKASKKQENDER